MNIPRSSLMEGEHTPTIIQLILLTDLAVIQLKDSHLFFIFPNTKFIGCPPLFWVAISVPLQFCRHVLRKACAWHARSLRLRCHASGPTHAGSHLYPLAMDMDWVPMEWTSLSTVSIRQSALRRFCNNLIVGTKESPAVLPYLWLERITCDILGACAARDRDRKKALSMLLSKHLGLFSQGKV